MEDEKKETEDITFETQTDGSNPSSTETDTDDKDKSSKKKVLLVFVAVIAFAIIAGATFFLLRSIFSDKEASPEETAPSQTEASVDANIDEVEVKDYSSTSSLDVSGLVEETMPSLVSITNKSVQEVNSFYSMFGFSGAPQTQEVTSLGSGIIIGKNNTELLIVTNAHVIADAKTLTVSFIDEQSYNAYVKGSDSGVDIAVIAIKLESISKDTLDKIKIAVFGDSDSAKIGQQIVAIGNALGYGQSVTTGIISARDRMTNSSTAPLFQIDAAINHGNSGGALFNMKGEVIGINFMKDVDVSVEGICYAIPSVSIIPLVQDFENKVAREKVPEDQASCIGIKGSDVTSTVEQTYGIPQGIYISEVVDDGPCDDADVPEKSIIVKFDGSTVLTMSKLKDTLLYYAAGEKVDITCMVYENGEYVEKVYNITLGKAEKTDTSDQAPTLPANNNPNEGNGIINPFKEFFGW